MPTPADLSRLLMAATFAADRHRDHRRSDAARSPYINHPLAVAALLAEEGGVTDVELLTAALLHDAVEDTATSHDEIVERFGSEVGDLVAEVTDDKSLPKESRKELQVEHAPATSDRGKQLKIADKIANIRGMDATAPKDWDIARKIEYLDWAERVVSGCRDVNAALDQLFDQAVRQARDRLDVSMDDLGP